MGGPRELSLAHFKEHHNVKLLSGLLTPLADPDCFAYRARSVDAYIDGSTPKWKTEFASVEFNSGCFPFVVVVVFQLRVTYFALFKRAKQFDFF